MCQQANLARRQASHGVSTREKYNNNSSTSLKPEAPGGNLDCMLNNMCTFLHSLKTKAVMDE